MAQSYVEHSDGVVGRSGTFTKRQMKLRPGSKTVEGVRWTMKKEEKAARAQREPPTVSDPTSLLYYHSRSVGATDEP